MFCHDVEDQLPMLCIYEGDILSDLNEMMYDSLKYAVLYILLLPFPPWLLQLLTFS